MNNLYNVKISYKGEREFSFTLPKYGEVTIYTGKDIYIKNIDVSGVEALRVLRACLLEHQINAKPDGCYRVIDLSEFQPVKPRMNYRQDRQPVASVADLKAELIKSNGPIIEEEIKVEEPVELEAPSEMKLEDYILTSTKHKGKTIKELTKQQLKQNLKYANEEDKKCLEAYIEELKDFNK